MEFNAAKDDEDDCDNWSYKTFKAPAKLSPPTDQHQTFYRPDALPVAQPTVSKHWRKKKRLLTRQAQLEMMISGASDSALMLTLCALQMLVLLLFN